MPYKPYIRTIQNLFETGQLTWDSPITKLPYIGNYLASRLQDEGIFYLQDVITEVSNVADSPEDIFNTVASWVTNSRAHTCANGRYLPRHFNRMGFNSLMDLLAYANSPDIPVAPVVLLEQGICQFNENHAGLAADGLEPGRPLCAKTLNYGNVGNEAPIQAMRLCPCKATEEDCEQNASCTWIAAPGGGACLSRNATAARRNYARDARPYGGDWQAAPKSLRPNTRRVAAPNREGYWYAFRGRQNTPPPASPPPQEDNNFFGDEPEPQYPQPQQEEPRQPYRLRRSQRIARVHPRRSGRLAKKAKK